MLCKTFFGHRMAPIHHSMGAIGGPFCNQAIKFDICEALGILRDHNPMRMMNWIVGFLALATLLDSSLYDGRYTRGTVQMFSAMATGFGFY